jgi:hypothetical protein
MQGYKSNFNEFFISYSIKTLILTVIVTLTPVGTVGAYSCDETVRSILGSWVGSECTYEPDAPEPDQPKVKEATIYCPGPSGYERTTAKECPNGKLNQRDYNKVVQILAAEQQVKTRACHAKGLEAPSYTPIPASMVKGDKQYSDELSLPCGEKIKTLDEVCPPAMKHKDRVIDNQYLPGFVIYGVCIKRYKDKYGQYGKGVHETCGPGLVYTPSKCTKYGCCHVPPATP